MSDNQLIHPHDKLFKDTFSRKSVVQSFVNEYLRIGDRSIIDLNTLEAVKDSHVKSELQGYFSDAVYTAMSPDRSNHVYLLFEHKSHTDHNVGSLLLENVTMLLQYHQRQHGSAAKQPVIIPVVICQGASGWNIQDQAIYSFGPFETYIAFFPDLRFTVIDLSRLSDSRISGHPSTRRPKRKGRPRLDMGCGENDFLGHG